MNDQPNTAQPINPMATAFVARYVAKVLLFVAGIFAAHGVAVTSQDGFHAISYETAEEILSLGLLAGHWLIAHKANIRFFNLGRAVQAGTIVASKLPPPSADVPSAPSV